MYKYGEIIEIDGVEYAVIQICDYKSEKYLLLVEATKSSKYMYVKVVGEDQVLEEKDPIIVETLLKKLSNDFVKQYPNFPEFFK